MCLWKHRVKHFEQKKVPKIKKGDGIYEKTVIGAVDGMFGSIAFNSCICGNSVRVEVNGDKAETILTPSQHTVVIKYLTMPWMQSMESEDCTWLSPGRTPRRKPHGSYRWMPW